MKAEVLKYNTQQFLDDLKRVRTVVIYAQTTRDFFITTKIQALKAASRDTINYVMRDDIFLNKRLVMVII